MTPTLCNWVDLGDDLKQCRRCGFRFIGRQDFERNCQPASQGTEIPDLRAIRAEPEAQRRLILPGQDEPGLILPSEDQRRIIVPAAKPRSRGLGDTIAKGTSFFGIKPCGGCGRRRKILNRLFPYSQ